MNKSQERKYDLLFIIGVTTLVSSLLVLGGASIILDQFRSSGGETNLQMVLSWAGVLVVYGTLVFLGSWFLAQSIWARNGKRFALQVIMVCSAVFAILCAGLGVGIWVYFR